MREALRADAQAVAAIDHFVDGFVSIMGSGPPPPWIFVPLMYLTALPLALVHELGHAAAALVLRPVRRVWIVVGRHPRRGDHPLPARWVVLGRLAIAFNPVPGLRRRNAECTYEAPSTPTECAVIAFAGPATTLFTGIVIWHGLIRVDPGLLHDLLWVMTFYSLCSVLINLIPFTTRSGGRPMPSDGATILAAFR